jgi:hypothetical protein
VPAVLFSAVLFLTENRWSQKRPYPLWLTTFGNCPLATAQPKTSRPNSLTQNAIELVITSDLIKKNADHGYILWSNGCNFIFFGTWKFIYLAAFYID